MRHRHYVRGVKAEHLDAPVHMHYKKHGGCEQILQICCMPQHGSINVFRCGAANVCYVCFVDLMHTVMEASSFTPSVYSVHALTLLAEVKHSCLRDSLNPSCTSVVYQAISQCLCQCFQLFILMFMEGQVKFFSPQNTAGFSQMAM